VKQPTMVRKVAYAAACALLLSFTGITAVAQTVIATIPAQEGSLGLPFTIAVNPFTQLVYIAGNGVEVVDQKTNTPITTFNIGQDQLSSIAINPVTRKLYVLDYLTGLYVVDLTGNTVVGQFAISNGYSLTYNPLTNRVYSLDHSGNIWVNDGTTGALIKDIATPTDNGDGQGFYITINPATNLIYLPVATLPGAAAVEVVNAITNAITTVPLKGNGSAYATVDTLRNIIYISDQLGQVDVLNGKTNTDIALITGIPILLEGITVDPVTRQVYLLNANSNVYVIDGTTNTLTSTVIPVGTNPIFSTIDLVHGLLYVGNTAEFQPGTQSISVLSLR
jgi:DNA-binding beta-propeller fold protein YncE